jgi:hypothetical protein
MVPEQRFRHIKIEIFFCDESECIIIYVTPLNMRQRRDPSLIKMQWKLDHDEVKAHKYISKIDPNFVYEDLYPETLLGLMASCYTYIPYVTIELIDDLIERTDPKYFTPHTGSLVDEYRTPLRSLLCNAMKKKGVNGRILNLVRKLIARMDFSLPDSVQLVLKMIGVKKTRYDFDAQILLEYGPDFSALLTPDLVLKGVLNYSDVIRINERQEVANQIDLLYVFNKANVCVDAGIVTELFEFV